VSEPQTAPRALHRFAVGTALATYLLIVIGGLVHGTGSTASCPSWPYCAEAPAHLAGGVAIEHGHRAAATLVGALTLGLAVVLTRARRRLPALPKLGWLAVALVAAQGALGGLGVVLRLPTAVAALHTGASLLFFLTVFYLAAQTADGAERRPALAPAARRLALVAATAVLFQALLGALVRSSGAALACPDFPLCRGSLWPAPVTMQLHVVHRLGAVVVAVLVFASAIRTYRAAAAEQRWLRALAVAAPVLAAAQISLGVRSVQTFLDLAIVQAHLAVGAALLAASWAVYLLSAPSRVTARPVLAQARALVELTKPRITTMVVVTFAGGLWLAPGAVAGWRTALALLGTVLIVGAANALNMYLERDIDGRMARTRRRPLPEGRLSPEVAVGLGAVLASAALPLLLVGANVLTAALGLLAFVSYVWVYTPLKRVSGAALFVGAVPGALPPLMGWTTTTGRLDAGGAALFAILFLWQVPHFLAIALYRSEDYARAGVRVLPLSQGPAATRWHIVLSTAALVAVSLLPTPLGVAGPLYLVAAALLGVGFFAVTLGGFRARALAGWARSVFLASLLYLTALFAALALGHFWR
jgi:protoheme IX farnesyltransferase